MSDFLNAEEFNLFTPHFKRSGATPDAIFVPHCAFSKGVEEFIKRLVSLEELENTAVRCLANEQAPTPRHP